MLVKDVDNNNTGNCRITCDVEDCVECVLKNPK
jgi:hypothetical protein